MLIPDWFKRIRFAFSHREHGQMSFMNSSSERVGANRRDFLSGFNMDLSMVVAGELPHRAKVEVVTIADAGRGSAEPNWIPGIDGLVTADPGLLLLTTHADCAPLVIYNPASNILGQAHAGWRGLAAGLVESLVSTMLSLDGATPDKLYAWIGPAARPCCYAVSSDVAGLFPPECLMLVADSTRLDMVEFIKRELKKLKFLPEQVTDSRICTCCNPEYSSFRRDGQRVEAMALVTGLI